MSAQLTAGEAEFYRVQSAVTDPGAEGRALLAGLPADPGELARIVRGLLVHRLEDEHFGHRHEERRLHEDAETRYADGILRILRERSAAPLTERRDPADRFVGTCRDFVVLHVALLRNAGVPARARAGTSTYFSPHHWVTEYAHPVRGWTLIDPELTFPPGEKDHGFAFDPYDVPRSAFHCGGTGWQRAREALAAGRPDDSVPGWPILVSDVLLDLAALNKVEMLPWDSWGASELLRNEEPAPGERALLDAVAAVTASPAPSLTEVRRLYRTDDRLRTPRRVRSFTSYLGIREVDVRH